MALVLVGTLGETESADSPTLANRIEQLIRTDETLHYQVHMTAGRVLTLLPRTRGLGVEQYRKASFHAPEAVRARKALLQKFPDALVQVDALLTCQQFLTERLRQSGQVPAFPAIDSLERGDLERAVMPQADGQANVVQVVLVRDARAPEDSSVGLDYLVYVCDVRTNVMGSLSLVDLVLLNGRPPA